METNLNRLEWDVDKKTCFRKFIAMKWNRIYQ